MTPELALRGVSLSLGGAPVVEDIDLQVRRGQVLVLLGPSGSGKTSLLRLMAGLMRPDRGRIMLNGSLSKPGHGNATVFQSYRLLPWKNVAANIGFALPHLPRDQRDARVAEVLRLVGLTRFAQHFPAMLSGGMKQRVALARALAPRPDFLLMDEPFAALDALARELMQTELLRLVAGGAAEGETTSGPGVVFVTHSVDEALMVGDCIAVLSARPGRIQSRLQTPFTRRAQDDPRNHPQWPGLRRQLWENLRDTVLDDPASDFHRPTGQAQGRGWGA